MTNDQIQAVRELVLQRIKTLETFDIEAGKQFPHTRTQALINEKQLKDLKGWIINHPIEEFDGDTLLEIAL